MLSGQMTPLPEMGVVGYFEVYQNENWNLETRDVLSSALKYSECACQFADMPDFHRVMLWKGPVK